MVVVVAVVRIGGDMLIEFLGLFSVVGVVVTAIHVYRTPVVKNVAPFPVRQRHVTFVSKRYPALICCCMARIYTDIITTRKLCCRKETARCHSCSFHFH